MSSEFPAGTSFGPISIPIDDNEPPVPNMFVVRPQRQKKKAIQERLNFTSVHPLVHLPHHNMDPNDGILNYGTVAFKMVQELARQDRLLGNPFDVRKNGSARFAALL